MKLEPGEMLREAVDAPIWPATISLHEATFRGTAPDSNNYRGALCLNMKRRGVANRWTSVIGWMFLIFVGSTDVLSAEQTSRFVVPFLLWLDP